MIKINEAELKAIVKESVEKVLSEGQIPDREIIRAIRKYVEQGDLKSVLQSHPVLIDVISQWLLENGEDEFIEMICHNFMDPRRFA